MIPNNFEKNMVDKNENINLKTKPKSLNLPFNNTMVVITLAEVEEERIVKKHLKSQEHIKTQNKNNNSRLKPHNNFLNKTKNFSKYACLNILVNIHIYFIPTP